MKKILITGCSGTIGSALVEKFSKIHSNKLICIDNNEGSLFKLSNKYSNSNTKFIFCDIRDHNKLNQLMSNIDVCFHAAALKHVGICEDSPSDAIKTNILGVNNLIDAAINNKIKKFIYTSSDKAVNPTNIMGASKLVGEKLITAANFRENNKKTIFTSVRFGNVIGSSGSVVPIFYSQIFNNKKLTITHKNMTRFLMGINDAVELICNCEKYAKGGEIFISKMPSTNIFDLAITMIKILNEKYNLNYDKKNIKFIGVRPGEKLYEELINNEEIIRTYETNSFYLVLPKIYKSNKSNYKLKLIKKTLDTEIKSNINKNLEFCEIKKFILKNYNF